MRKLKRNGKRGKFVLGKNCGTEILSELFEIFMILNCNNKNLMKFKFYSLFFKIFKTKFREICKLKKHHLPRSVRFNFHIIPYMVCFSESLKRILFAIILSRKQRLKYLQTTKLHQDCFRKPLVIELCLKDELHEQ